MGTGMICNCKQVSYGDVDKALQQMEKFDDVLSAFEEVQKVTHCSTGCGGCHDKIMEAISEVMMRQEQVLREKWSGGNGNFRSTAFSLEKFYV